MTAHDAQLRALRDNLTVAIKRDLARPRRRARFVAVIAAGALTAGTGVAAATGVLFADPKPDPAVPAVADWVYYSHLSSGASAGGGPVLARPRPAALARTNRATEEALRVRGITARCGGDASHPLACYLPSGDPVPADDLNAALASLEGAHVLESSADNYEIRPLSDAEARQWLCDHPSQRPEGDATPTC
jgi:hypothetical protein